MLAEQIATDEAEAPAVWAARMRQRVPVALVEALTAAQGRVVEAQAAYDGAAERLSKHNAARPTVPGQVPDWGRKRATLEDERDAYAHLLADVQQAHQAAQRAHDSALGALWDVEEANAQQALRVAQDAGAARIVAAERELFFARQERHVPAMAAQLELNRVLAARAL